MTPRLTSIPRRTPQLACLLVSMVLVAAGCASGSTGSPLASPTLPGNAALATGAPATAATGPTSLVENGSTGSGAGVAQAGSTGSAGPNVATVYPYPGYAGSPGLAPDHTIVVTGTGTAAMKANLSDRATAERSAIAAALADAKAQAEAVASAAGVTLGGVLSVSVSSGQSYAVPMMVPNSVPPTAPGADPAVKLPTSVPTEPGAPELAVSVTVEYRIG